MIRFYLICIFLCAPFFTKGQATAKADSLFGQGQHLLARVEYERLLFAGGQDNNSLLLKKSYCFKAEGKFEEAYLTLQRADFFQGTDSLKLSLYYESALTAHLALKYDLSINKIRELQYYFPDFSNPMIDLLEILNLNYQHKLPEAKRKFIAFKGKYGLSDVPNIYEKRKFRKLKSPEKAESISHFLPGVGQAYAGYTVRGITSGLIQTGLLSFTAISFINAYYFSGAFTGMGLFSMFNNGGARHAQYLAEKRNALVIDELNLEVKRIAAHTIKK
jgi:TM2 domain-containing membrane protein YozV